MRHSSAVRPTIVTKKVLRDWALPLPDEDSDKEERGGVLVVGGSRDMPGAVILAATGALRAGAGKLQVATVKSISGIVGASVPEARVFALAETKSGAISPQCVDELAKRVKDVQAVLFGPGMIEERMVGDLMIKLLPSLGNVPTIIDAAALACLTRNSKALRHLSGKVVITPHAGEMAKLTGKEKTEITDNPFQHALEAARKFHSIVALKGSETYIVRPDGSGYVNRTGNVGLATSGSGDTLAGITSGLLARGADPMQATVWGVYLHGSAGEHLRVKVGPLGFLARELLDEIPALMWQLSRS